VVVGRSGHAGVGEGYRDPRYAYGLAAFFRPAQYAVMRVETAFRWAAVIRRPRFVAFIAAFRIRRRGEGAATSANAEIAPRTRSRAAASCCSSRRRASRAWRMVGTGPSPVTNGRVETS